MAKYRLIVEFETSMRINTNPKPIDELLDGSLLYDSNFMGAVTKTSLKKVG